MPVPIFQFTPHPSTSVNSGLMVIQQKAQIKEKRRAEKQNKENFKDTEIRHPTLPDKIRFALKKDHFKTKDIIA